MKKTAGERTLLSGALSIEFSDCSIAAADLSRLVSERMADAKNSTMTILGDEEHHYAAVTDAYNPHRRGWRDDLLVELDGHRTKLLLGQKLNRNAHSISGASKRGGLFRRKANDKKIQLDLDTTSDPFLAVVVGHDALLPIASFARRTGGNCDYVQLGQEMEDDNFYVTAADEYTHRHLLVEALRAYVKNEGLDEEKIQLIQKFVDSQSQTHRAELEKSYGAQLAKHADWRLDRAMDSRRLTILGDGQPATTDYTIYNLAPPMVDRMSGRAVSFDLVRPRSSHPGDPAVVVAITRENLALPLINLSPADGLAEVLATQHNESKISVVRDVLELVSMVPYEPRKVYIENYNTGDNQVRKYLGNIGLAICINTEGYDSYHGVPADTCLSLDDYFAYPNPVKEMPYLNCDSKFQEIIHDYYSVRKPLFDKLLSNLKVEMYFYELLGSAEEYQERFFHYLGRIALQPEGKMGAVFKDMKINNTSGDVTIEAQVTPVDEVYKLVVSGRPSSMADEPMKPLISAWIDSASPKPIRYIDKKPLERSDEVELTDILANIYSQRLS